MEWQRPQVRVLKGWSQGRMGQAWTEENLLTERGSRGGLAKRAEGFCQQPCGTTLGRIWLLVEPAGLKRDWGPRWSLLSQQVVSSSPLACRELVGRPAPEEGNEEDSWTVGLSGRKLALPCGVGWPGLPGR